MSLRLEQIVVFFDPEIKFKGKIPCFKKMIAIDSAGYIVWKTPGPGLWPCTEGDQGRDPVEWDPCDQTDRQTDRQTDTTENITFATPFCEP